MSLSPVTVRKRKMGAMHMASGDLVDSQQKSVDVPNTSSGQLT